MHRRGGASDKNAGRVHERHSIWLADDRRELPEYDRAGRQVRCVGRANLMFALARLKLYAIGVAVFIAALLKLRHDAVSKALLKMQADQAEKRIDAMRCLLYTSPSPRDRTRSRMPSSA